MTTTHTPAPADDPDAVLRTGLTQLAADRPGRRVLSALLAAHPAPETDEERVERAVQRWAHEMGLLPDEIDGTHYHAMAAALSEVAHPAPVSGTRREDMAREIAETHWTTTHEGFHCVGCGWNDVGAHEDYGHAARRHVAEVALAVLPAPPVVDEAEIAKVLAEFDSVPWANMRRETKDIYRSMAAAVAARLRGATRG